MSLLDAARNKAGSVRLHPLQAHREGRGRRGSASSSIELTRPTPDCRRYEVMVPFITLEQADGSKVGVRWLPQCSPRGDRAGEP